MDGYLGLFHPYKWSYGPQLITRLGDHLSGMAPGTLGHGQFWTCSFATVQNITIRIPEILQALQFAARCWARTGNASGDVMMTLPQVLRNCSPKNDAFPSSVHLCFFGCHFLVKPMLNFGRVCCLAWSWLKTLMNRLLR